MILEAANKALWPAGSKDFVETYDNHLRTECPACSALGWLFGDEVGRHRHPIEYDYENQAAWQIEDRFYHTEAFACTACTLRLVGRVELDAAEFTEEFSEEHEVEPDFEPDYGND